MWRRRSFLSSASAFASWPARSKRDYVQILAQGRSSLTYGPGKVDSAEKQRKLQPRGQRWRHKTTCGRRWTQERRKWNFRLIVSLVKLALTRPRICRLLWKLWLFQRSRRVFGVARVLRLPYPLFVSKSGDDLRRRARAPCWWFVFNRLFHFR